MVGLKINVILPFLFVNYVWHLTHTATCWLLLLGLHNQSLKVPMNSQNCPDCWTIFIWCAMITTEPGTRKHFIMHPCIPPSPTRLSSFPLIISFSLGAIGSNIFFSLNSWSVLFCFSAAWDFDKAFSSVSKISLIKWSWLHISIIFFLFEELKTSCN